MRLTSERMRARALSRLRQSTVTFVLSAFTSSVAITRSFSSPINCGALVIGEGIVDGDFFGGKVANIFCINYKFRNEILTLSYQWVSLCKLYGGNCR